jgi:hypothetical protein
MARTYRNTKYKKWHCKERKEYRKTHYRQYRHKVKRTLRAEEWEHVPRFRKTCGWLTW